LRFPAQFSFGAVVEQNFDFGRTMEGRIDQHIFLHIKFFISSPARSKAMRRMSRTVVAAPTVWTAGSLRHQSPQQN
jgi:hypothetical protein